jgi:hypothetical protein
MNQDPMMEKHDAAPDRYAHTCPYCHEGLDALDAETHIVGCCVRWRIEHHVAPSPGSGASPAIARWIVEAPVGTSASAHVERSVDAVRRAVESPTHTVTSRWGRFRSLPGYEPVV